LTKNTAMHPLISVYQYSVTLYFPSKSKENLAKLLSNLQ